MNPPPRGWPRVSASIFYDDARAAIDWLCRAFGFEVQIVVPGEDGGVVHSELVYGGGLIMVGQAGGHAHRAAPWSASPRSLGGRCTQALFLYVDDIEAHSAQARAAGAKITSDLVTNDYGPEYWSDRSYQAEDPEGHRWWFAQRLRSPG